MKKKFFGFLTAVLTLGILGGTAFVAADNGLQKEEVAKASSEVKIYFDLTWSNISEVKIKIGTASSYSSMTTSTGDDLKIAKYNATGTISDSKKNFALYFKQDSSYWHPQKQPGISNPSDWDTNTNQINYDLVGGHSYKISGVNWTHGYNDNTQKWFKYTIEDLGAEYPLYEVGSTIYFKPMSDWLNDEAWFAAEFVNNSTSSWVKGTYVDGDYYSFVVPSGDWNGLKIGRMNPAAETLSSTNRWNVSGTIRYEEGKNLLTQPNDTWNDFTGTWSIVAGTYTINYYDPNNVNTPLDTTTQLDGSKWNSKFIEKEDYRLEGWYTDSTLNNEFKKGTTVTSNLNLYAKYVKASDYRILVEEDWLGASDEAKHSMSVYLWRDALDGGNNNAWPGEKVDLSVKFDNYYILEIDASKSFDKIIINNDLLQDDPKQTIDVELSTDDLAVYNIGDLDKDKFNISCEGVNEISFAYKIYELAGDFVDNGNEITEQCAYKYQTAKEMFLNLSDDDKIDFQGFNSGDKLAAKTTYEHWCKVNNDNTPYEGPVVSGSNIAINFAQDNSAYLLIILLFVGLSMAGFIVIKRKRKAN